ncbi:MAG: DNA-3-methyladenine glycosylase I [Nitrospirota bacterium]
MKKIVKRCAWTNNDELMIAYHDHEWGVPLHDENRLFEFLILEGAQAGLSWLTILKKRENYRRAYDDFDVNKVAGYKSRKIGQLLNDPGIVRNKQKISASIVNAKEVIRVRKEFGSLDAYLWGFVGGRPVISKRKKMSDIPSHTPESDAMSKDMKRRGFKFVGTTICCAFMQAVGMVNDHEASCFKYGPKRASRDHQDNR